jgi:hypothetical protein
MDRNALARLQWRPFVTLGVTPPFQLLAASGTVPAGAFHLRFDWRALALATAAV